MIWRDTSGNIVTRKVGDRLLDNSGNEGKNLCNEMV